MDEKLGPNNIVDIGLVRSEVILYIVKFVLIGIDVKAFGVPSAAISNVHSGESDIQIYSEDNSSRAGSSLPQTQTDNNIWEDICIDHTPRRYSQ